MIGRSMNEPDEVMHWMLVWVMGEQDLPDFQVILVMSQVIVISTGDIVSGLVVQL